MSGHSKWSTIKRKKGAADAARGKQFSKAVKEIMIAVKQGGGSDPEANPRLRTAVQAAKGMNMPNANIDRAIKKAAGGGEGSNIEETQYEGYGPGGVAILVMAATDNRNRTTGEIRHMFTKSGSNLGEAGSVAYQFEPRGLVLVDKSAIAENDLIEMVLEAGADDVGGDGDTYEILTSTAALESVKRALAGGNVPIQTAELTRIAANSVPLDGPKAESLLKLLDQLEDHEDVQKVYANFSIPDEVMERLSR